MRAHVAAEVLGAAALSAAIAGPAQRLHAQEPTHRPPAVFAVGLAVGTASISVGGGGRGTTGIAILARRQIEWLVLDLELHPYEVPSPVMDERFRAVYALAGARIRLGAHGYVTPSLGLQVRSWGGSQRVEARDVGIAIGLALGGEIPLTRRILLRPEIAYRSASVQFEGNVSTQVTSIRVLLSRRR